MRRSGSGMYALIIIVGLIGACIFGVMALQGVISTTDPSSVAETNLSGVNSTVNATLGLVFAGMSLPVWFLIIAGVCLSLYAMVKVARRK